MGGPKWYNKETGHTDNKYEPANANAVVTVNGVKGTLLKRKDDASGAHSNLPAYSKTSDMYFRYGTDGKTVAQGSLYIGQKKVCDFDWGHTHRNNDGTLFPKGTVHVHMYGSGMKGTRVRINNGDARKMTSSEIAKYGPIIKRFNPNAKF